MDTSHRMKSAQIGGTKPRVLIVGGNLAGISAARNLSPNRFQVTVVDPSIYVEWLPNIHELVSKKKDPTDLRHHRGELLKALKHQFVLDAVVHLDSVEKYASLASGAKIYFDFCIMAAGGISNDMGVQGVNAHAFRFKSVRDSYQISSRLQKLADTKRFSHIVIVGGGIEGIEALGEVLRRYRKKRCFEVHLIDAQSQLLSSRFPALDKRIRDLCKNQPVHFHHSTRVGELANGCVILENGERLQSDCTIWTGGAKPNPLLASSGLARAPLAWANVDDYLISSRFDNTLVIGDAADLPTGLSKQAYHAIGMGKAAAMNIERLAKDLLPQKFNITAKPTLVSFGDLDTFLMFNNTSLASPLLTSAKETIYQVGFTQLNPPRGIVEGIEFVERFNKGAFGLINEMKNPISFAGKLFKSRFLN